MFKDFIAKLVIPKNTPYCYIPKKPIKPVKNIHMVVINKTLSVSLL